MEVSGKRIMEKEKGGYAETDKLCEPCHDEHVTTSANGMCQECKEYMCNRCFRHHLKARQCRNHVMVDASHSSVSSDKDEDFEKCRHHEKELIKYYCRKHDIVGCGDCMVDGHGACRPEFIKDLSKHFQENKDFKILVRKFDKLATANKESEKTIQDYKKEIKEMHENILKEIAKFRTEINQILDNAEGDIKAEIDRLTSNTEHLLTRLDKECRQLSSNIDKVKQKIDAGIFRGNTLFTHLIESKPDILKIERALDRIQSEIDIKKINFVPDTQLSNIVVSGVKLGSLNVPTSVESDKKYCGGEVDQTAQSQELIQEKEEIRSHAVFIGARVRPMPSREIREIHHGQPGTVISVYQSRKVAVEWDYSGMIEYGHSVGATRNDSVFLV